MNGLAEDLAVCPFGIILPYQLQFHKNRFDDEWMVLNREVIGVYLNLCFFAARLIEKSQEMEAAAVLPSGYVDLAGKNAVGHTCTISSNKGHPGLHGFAAEDGRGQRVSHGAT